MHEDVASAIAGLAVGVTKSAQPAGTAKLTVLHREKSGGLPGTPDSEIRVLFAILDPGDCTPYHSHRHPVTVFVTEGVFTLELDGREPVAVGAGEVFVEPPHVKMTGRNLSADRPTRMAIFYVCDPDEPFADPA